MAAEHPALRFLEQITGDEWPAGMPDDVAQRHDQYLTEPSDE